MPLRIADSSNPIRHRKEDHHMLAGVDIGGTFTDLVISEGGTLRIHKLLSTPDDPARAMLAGLAEAGAQAADRVAHGSTVATNAILERRGARTAFITTAGFRDLLFIGRQDRPVLYALQPQLPPPLIPRELCFEVPERLDHTGAVLTPLDLAALDAVLDAVAAAEVEAVAVCLLYSFRNPAHENQIHDRLIEREIVDSGQISLSCEVLPEFREYERATTVALDAYVRPVMSRYLARLEETLPDRTRLLVMKSDGGVVSATAARAEAIQTALSGPAAGVIGAHYLASLAGFEQIITLDMGGTSTDVALCPGEPARRAEAMLDGLPLRTRLIDIETIGAGGGSIARLDPGGALRVGPQSAGADPGPIIYGRGGAQITVSDANAVLGRLDAERFLDGGLRLDIDAAQVALADLGGQMGVPAEEAAAGVLDVANSNIDRALRRVSVARGHDPRDFTLMAFGGAGPLHACAVAEELEMARVLIPRYPGVLCAFGLLAADVLRDYSQTALLPDADAGYDTLREAMGELLRRARRDLAAEGIRAAQMRFQPQIDLRYAGQSFELTVPFAPGLADTFHDAHEQAYGHALTERPVEAVTLRLSAVGTIERPHIEAEPETPHRAEPLGWRADLALFERESLRPGAQFDGPALVFQLDSTSYIAPGWSARADSYRNLVLERA
jgi:N-methylhydantoinase A